MGDGFRSNSIDGRPRPARSACRSNLGRSSSRRVSSRTLWSEARLTSRSAEESLANSSRALSVSSRSRWTLASSASLTEDRRAALMDSVKRAVDCIVLNKSGNWSRTSDPSLSSRARHASKSKRPCSVAGTARSRAVSVLPPIDVLLLSGRGSVAGFAGWCGSLDPARITNGLSPAAIAWSRLFRQSSIGAVRGAGWSYTSRSEAIELPGR